MLFWEWEDKEIKLWLQFVGNAVYVVVFFFFFTFIKKKKKPFKTPLDPGFIENGLLLKNRILMGTDFS